MGQLSSMFGNLPGFGTVVESFEQAYTWGPYPRYYQGAYIASTTADTTNTPTWELRRGLLLGKQLATGTWTNYSPTATDGSEVAAGVLVENLRMQDVFSGVNTTKFYGIMVSGGVRAAGLIGLDNMARAQMSQSFYFDDFLPGNHQYPWQRFQAKTANYTLLPSDNLSLFTTLGASGEVDFTLPAILNGYYFGFSNQVDQVMKVISAEGTNMILMNNASASSAAFSTGSQQIGGLLRVYSNPAATKWIVENDSAGANTVTVA